MAFLKSSQITGLTPRDIDIKGFTQADSIDLGDRAYTEHEVLLADAYNIKGNVTVSDNLILSKLSDDGEAITITGDTTTRTISGSGSIETSTLAQTPNASLTGMTGTIGNAVNLDSATFPAGMVRQVKWANMGAVATDDTEVYLPNSIQFSNAILASSDVWMSASGCGAKRAGSNDVNLDAWFSSADGGSLGEGASGFKWLQDFGAYSGTVAHFHDNFSGAYLVTNPGSTTPTFKIYIDRAGDYEIHFIHMTIMEITG